MLAVIVTLGLSLGTRFAAAGPAEPVVLDDGIRSYEDGGMACDESQEDAETSDAQQPLTSTGNTAICAAAAAVATGLGCAAIMADCAAGTALTVGSIAIPCVLLTALACGVGAGGAAIITAYCPALANR